MSQPDFLASDDHLLVAFRGYLAAQVTLLLEQRNDNTCADSRWTGPHATSFKHVVRVLMNAWTAIATVTGSAKFQMSHVISNVVELLECRALPDVSTWRRANRQDCFLLTRLTLDEAKEPVNIACEVTGKVPRNLMCMQMDLTPRATMHKRGVLPLFRRFYVQDYWGTFVAMMLFCKCFHDLQLQRIETLCKSIGSLQEAGAVLGKLSNPHSESYALYMDVVHTVQYLFAFAMRHAEQPEEIREIMTNRGTHPFPRELTQIETPPQTSKTGRTAKRPTPMDTS